MVETIDVDKKQIEDQIKKFKRWIIPILIVIAALIVLFTGLYKVDPSEQALVLRFGKYVRKAGPGLHFKIPFGVESAIIVKTERVFKEEFGFRTRKAGVETKYARGTYQNESLMLTGDLNIADAEWIVQYQKVDPEKYIFNIRKQERTVRDITEAVVRRVVGDRTVNEVLTTGREQVQKVVMEKLQEILDSYESGIDIVTVNLKNVNPPEKVRASFNEVNEAKQDKEKYVNQAKGQYNEKVPEARGQAKKMISQAEGYAKRRINRSQGDAKRFVDIYREYRLAKRVTRRRLYLETMKEVIPQVEEVYVVDEKQKSLLPLLDLNKSIKK